jgi:hypothetical protein
MPRKTTSEFIEQAKAVHNDKYTYENTIYTKSTNKVRITCPVHGEFTQKAANHLQGSGCKKCRPNQTGYIKKTTKDFVERASVKHNGYYNYDKTNYTGSNNKLTITCPIHGDFEQMAGNHLKGSGCPKCGSTRAAEKQVDGLEKFINKANKIHNYCYSYQNAIYTTARKNITITCPVHGDFEQLPTNHLKGVGCPGCNGGIFTLGKPTLLYYLSINDGEAYKLGITSKTVETRFNPVDVKKIDVLLTHQFDDGKKAYLVEQHLLKLFNKYEYTGKNLLQSGNTELLTCNVFTELKDILTKLSNSASLAEIQSILDSL